MQLTTSKTTMNDAEAVMLLSQKLGDAISLQQGVSNI
jgi:hypothetical protein